MVNVDPIIAVELIETMLSFSKLFSCLNQSCLSKCCVLCLLCLVLCVCRGTYHWMAVAYAAYNVQLFVACDLLGCLLDQQMPIEYLIVKSKLVSVVGFCLFFCSLLFSSL